MAKKRVIVLLLAGALAALGIYAYWSGTSTAQVLAFIAIGVSLAVVFLVRGSLPDVVHRHLHVQSDDDPDNISPKVYLPIVLIAAIAAAALLFWTIRR